MNANKIPKSHLVGPFSWEVPPRKSGVYIRVSPREDLYYAYYDTKYDKWFAYTGTIRLALDNKYRYLVTMYPDLPWYGITEEFHKELSK